MRHKHRGKPYGSGRYVVFDVICCVFAAWTCRNFVPKLYRYADKCTYIRE